MNRIHDLALAAALIALALPVLAVCLGGIK